MASVEIQTPDGVVRVRLDREHFTIGRLSTNDIPLPFPHISRQHAELRLMGQTWWVVDLRSTNGLHVGSERVGESKLVPGTVVMLSPLVSLSLLEESAPPSFPQAPEAPTQQIAYPQHPNYPQQPGFSQRQPSYPQQPGYQQPPSYPQQPSFPQQPSAPLPPSFPQQAAPAPAREAYTMARSVPSRESITPLSALGPRSPYADDEAPYYPQMRQTEAPYPLQPSYAPGPYVAPDSRPRQSGPASTPAHGDPGAHVFDPQQQAAHVFEQRRVTHGVSSPLLHVCQTCGQRTAPDAVYCQSCHHSIASECARCRFSLLPIQDLCPRCQTPNPYAVRRYRRVGEPS